MAVNPNSLKNLKPIKKGEVRNPKGRKAVLPELEKIIAEALSQTKEGLTAAEAILQSLIERAVNGDNKAAEILLDRAYGKAKQTVDMQTDNGFKIVMETISKKV